ncbi:hypothetical protein AVEN_241770-1 [Araneus ventricosus]|uniref:Uncharacterized protein n=1 Tax=Araneus ventricosus TaxID=182803 RepID=A0A4Y2FM64_ARAVE|nr:hypothetical protein AVEN_241770-1 [Araneus ventricosus]
MKHHSSPKHLLLEALGLKYMQSLTVKIPLTCKRCWYTFRVVVLRIQSISLNPDVSIHVTADSTYHFNRQVVICIRDRKQRGPSSDNFTVVRILVLGLVRVDRALRPRSQRSSILHCLCKFSPFPRKDLETAYSHEYLGWKNFISFAVRLLV